MAEISSKAVVLNPAGLADDVRVGPFSFLGPEVTAGPGTVIANNVTITGRTTIDSQCTFFPGCIIGSAAAGHDGPGRTAGACSIGKGNVIREHVIVEAGQTPDGPGTVIGENNLVMVGCQVGHDARLEGEGLFANFTRIEHHARVEKYVRTSGFTNINLYTTVGAYTFTTGYAGIDRDAPPYAIVQGYPFRVRAVNTENLRRCGFDNQAIAELKGAFRALFDGKPGAPGPEQLRWVEESFPGEHVRYLVESIRRSSASPMGRFLQPRP